jgi:hypothetical protein
MRAAALLAFGFVLGMTAAMARASIHLLGDIHAEPWNGDGEYENWRDW